jgi:hypothetical protein
MYSYIYIYIYIPCFSTKVINKDKKFPYIKKYANDSTFSSNLTSILEINDLKKVECTSLTMISKLNVIRVFKRYERECNQNMSCIQNLKKLTST